MLLHRPEDTLTTDEQVSLESFLAFIDEMDGCRVTTFAHRWARRARQVDEASRATVTDPLPSQMLEWIAVQRTADLNSFQRSRLEAIPGWNW